MSARQLLMYNPTHKKRLKPKFSEGTQALLCQASEQIVSLVTSIFTQEIQKSKKHRYATFVIQGGMIEVETVSLLL